MVRAAGVRRAPWGRAVGVVETVLTAALLLPGCTGKAHPGSVRYDGGAGKVPVTAASEEAYHAYLRGRDLQEKLRGTDAREHFRLALELDPDLAMAHLALAETAPDGTAFYDSLERAEAQVDRLSAGERETILGFAAGVRGDPETQRSHYETLVRLYPKDERSHSLLASHFFERRELESAIEHYERAVELAPDFSQPYNQLGYAYRFLGKWDRAETAFKRYVELIPEEPNPYDSYAEMLMKMGRFDESIEVYRKALSFDPEFVPSYIGVGNNQILKGDTAAALDTFDRLHTVARTDGERRTARLWTALAYLHAGDRVGALRTLQDRYEIAASGGDHVSMADDLLLLADVQLEAGETDAARATLERSEAFEREAGLPEDVVGRQRLRRLYLATGIAIAEGDLERAQALVGEFQGLEADGGGIDGGGRSAELLARIALAEERYPDAMRRLEQGDKRDPRVLYLLSVACRRAGELDRARELALQVANYNAIHVNLAHVRPRALAALAERG